MRKKKWLAGVLAVAMAVATVAPAAALAEEIQSPVVLEAEYATATGETASHTAEPADEKLPGEAAPESVPAATAEIADLPAENPVFLGEETPAQTREASQLWDGVATDTTWYEASEQQFTLTTAAQFAGLAQLVNEGNTFAKKTILLGADLDLNGQEWTPIGGADTGKTFAGTFDGQNHTVSNLKITRALENTGKNNRIGLFGAGTSAARIQNFTLRNAEVSGSLQVAAVLGGSGGAEAKISNVHVTGRIQVRGWWYVGGILGKGYSNVTDCSVEGDGTATSAVAITGGYAGGIVGFMGEDNNVTSGCTVKNLTVSGAHNGIGGINGILHYGNTIRDCTLENVVVWQTTDPEEETGRIYVGAFAGTYLDNNGKTPPTLANCEFTGEIYSGAAKKDVLEPTRYVGSLWYGAEPPATVQIENCTIHIPEKTPQPLPGPGNGVQTPAPQPSPAPTVTPAPVVSATPSPTATPAAPATSETKPANSVTGTTRPTSTAAPATSRPDGGAADVTVQTQATVQENKAVAAVERTELTKAVEQAVAEAKAGANSPVVTVEIAAEESAQAMEVTLPADALRALTDTEKAQFTVKSAAAEVSFDKNALTAILEQAQDEVVLVVTPVEKGEMTDAQAEAAGDWPTFELTLRSGGEIISRFGEGNATVTLPYTLAEGQQAEGIVVWYLAEDGGVTTCETSYNPQTGKVTFVTPHFSRYVIAYDESLLPEQSTPEQAEIPATAETAAGETPDSGMPFPVLLAVLVLLLLAVIVVVWVRKHFSRR